MYQFLEAAVLALQAIWANKLRSLLTVLGNIVAVTSIIAVVSLVQGLNSSVAGAIQSRFAADTFTVMRTGRAATEAEQLRMQSNPRISLDDAQAVRDASHRIGLVMAQARAGAPVRFRGVQIDSVSVRGVTKEYVSLPTTQIERGRPITPGEFEAGRFVAILGYDTADRLFGALDPVEKTITIAGVHFQVIGVAPKLGAIFGQSQDQFAVIPLEALMRLFGTRLSLELLVQPTSPDEAPAAIDDVRVAMRVERRLRPKDPDNFGIVSSEMMFDMFQQATALIFGLLIGVVSLSLVVGGIVIMNIMLMVVSERTREIGLRKSLGARRRDIMWQILTESITLSTFGGVVGTTLGFVVAWVISLFTPLPAIVEVWSVALGITMTAAVGLFFGMYPAMRAARLDPIEALRRE
jgi:putative ABC transport system permease protein